MRVSPPAPPAVRRSSLPPPGGRSHASPASSDGANAAHHAVFAARKIFSPLRNFPLASGREPMYRIGWRPLPRIDCEGWGIGAVSLRSPVVAVASGCAPVEGLLAAPAEIRAEDGAVYAVGARRRPVRSIADTPAPIHPVGGEGFTDSLGTRTQSVDLVASVDLPAVAPVLEAGETERIFVGSWIRTAVTKRDPEALNRQRIVQLEDALLPKVPFNTAPRREQERWSAFARLNYFGSYFEYHADVEGSYKPLPGVELTSRTRTRSRWRPARNTPSRRR